ncbi:MAG: Crp/Fnr family transcriptional regulator [Thermodesulfobacteriota bacterium]
MNDRIRFLALSELFNNISPADLADIETLLTEVSLPKDTQIFSEDDIGDNMYLLSRGSVKITIRMVWRKEEEEWISIIRPGEIFGEFSFIDGAKRSASAWTMEDSSALVLSRADFDRYSLEKPSVALAVMHNFAWLLTRKVRSTTLLYRNAKH